MFMSLRHQMECASFLSSLRHKTQTSFIHWWHWRFNRVKVEEGTAAAVIAWRRRRWQWRWGKGGLGVFLLSWPETNLLPRYNEETPHSVSFTVLPFYSDSCRSPAAALRRHIALLRWRGVQEPATAPGRVVFHTLTIFTSKCWTIRSVFLKFFWTKEKVDQYLECFL